MGVEYLYLGDIGDNYEERKRLTVYRIREPDVRAGGYTSRSSGGVDRRVIPEADYDTLTLRVPDRPSNSEVMMIDPWTQAVYVITKEDAIAAVKQQLENRRQVGGADKTGDFGADDDGTGSLRGVTGPKAPFEE